MTDQSRSHSEGRDLFSKRLLDSARATFDMFAIYLGDQLGWYRTLADSGWITSTQLAEQTRTSERYAREWLEQQSVSGILEVEDETADATSRRFRIPAAHVEVLVDEDSLSFLAPMTQLLSGALHPLSDVLEAYRTGQGVPYEAYGANLRAGQARMNRPMYLKLLGSRWLPAIADVHERLRADPPACIADIGCGAGWSCIGMAKAYANVRVDGFDLDAPSVELAIRNVQDASLADRVHIHQCDAREAAVDGPFDLVTAFECIHDMPDPVRVLSTMRRLAGETGVVLVVDERVSHTFTTQSEEMDPMMYGWSLFHCLPVGMADRPSAATGTVMRADTLRVYALQAGFRDVGVLPIKNPLFRFYRLQM